MSETAVFIRSARRPILVARHRDAVAEIDGALSDTFISGAGGNRRLEALHAELDQPEQAALIEEFLEEIAGERVTQKQTVHQAVVETLCLRREAGLTEAARLQNLAIGAYRSIRRAVAIHQGGEQLDLAAIRALPVPAMVECRVPRTFADPAFPRMALPSFKVKTLAAMDRLLHPVGADERWNDEDGGLVITPDDALTADPEATARDRIRSRFYRAVFIKWMSPDILDPKEVASHATVLSWLEDLSVTPHLYPFLQGQTAGQKAFRIGQLTGKIIRLFELYARVAQAAANPRHSEELASLNTRSRLALLAKLRYPAIRAPAELILATAACPFPAFIAFVQDRMSRGDLVLPPEPKP